MIEIVYPNQNSERIIKDIINNRNNLSFGDINKKLEDMFLNISTQGDKAVRKYTKEFDKVELDDFLVPQSEIEAAYQRCSKEIITALKRAKENIEKYHSKQLKNSWITNDQEGIILGQLYNPIQRVGVYIPGGTAPYPSTVLMNTIPAVIAGVSDIIMITPPKPDGSISDIILVAAKIVGIKKIFKVGGAQGIFALTLGTESIPKVDKIVGPGNIYVAWAKKMAFGHVDIDMIAGPSEILVIADDSAKWEFVAADLLSQAEHDTMAASILITTSEKLAQKVLEELKEQTIRLSRKDIIKESLQKWGKIFVVKDLEEAIYLSNLFAPEHLELMVENPFPLLSKIKNAGAIFMGPYSPEPLGDYFAGPNHTLPTNGTARFFSPLSVDDFQKKTSVIYYDKDNLQRVEKDITTISDAEGLTAHSNSVRIRFKKE